MGDVAYYFLYTYKIKKGMVWMSRHQMPYHVDGDKET